MSETFQRAAADDSHDGRYTNKHQASPGMPGQPKPEHTQYPKWVTPPDGKAVIVADPDEEAVVMSTTPPPDASPTAPIPVPDVRS